MTHDIANTFNSHAGKLLVSLMPLSGTLSDLFYRSVVLVLQDTPQGACGVDLAHPLNRYAFRGGAGNHSAIIFRNDAGLPSWMPPIPNLPSLGYIATFGPRPTMEELNNEPPPIDQKVFCGSAQWAQGEIRNEIDLGCWHVLDADEDLVWKAPSGVLYDLCIQKIYASPISP